eukprot:scaffold272407_cov37-Tisochrysis_lutea.AAC.1
MADSPANSSSCAARRRRWLTMSSRRIEPKYWVGTPRRNIYKATGSFMPSWPHTTAPASPETSSSRIATGERSARSTARAAPSWASACRQISS